ncbi:MAG: nucleotidyltransferase substrate binding protein [Nitrospirae bacterium]|nr:nucleotidyltransferase substrate binding protein [Nitrospirota bacterium]
MGNEYTLQKLKRAFLKLNESVDKVVDELDRDGVIQRFEFTFELFWKALKSILAIEGFECAGPRSCIKEGARRGLASEGEILLDMLEDRNKASHIYDESTAVDIFGRIRDNYIKVIADNITLFENYLAGEENP